MNPDTIKLRKLSVNTKVIKMASVIKTTSLGDAQLALEAATKEHLAAQANYVKASERLTTAEEQHTSAMTALVNEISTVRDKNKVPNLQLK